MKLRCRLNIHRWSIWTKPIWVRHCFDCGKVQQHRYAGPYAYGGPACPCALHSLPKHPSTYPVHTGLLALFECCWCECDHTPDEERWAAA